MADSEYLVASAGRIPSSCSLCQPSAATGDTPCLFDDLSDRHRELGQAAADAMGARFLAPPRDGRAMDAGQAGDPS
jgi:hypothetical protein